ncbi:hypothetical protein [Ancylobacter defluvii]|uniref:Uncharacterized protein n=1 Tax=Ancylobacter defluvii TaxID=1282440 RepID=A0A9W6JYI6_9HYPH|nr:hypothetical protein [Ancylobacter defluvii]MBS7586069.1 hypothetical protein [Ancylobacter defluvii]GLK84455.1 hypothetical protein GCM10017653_25250 [Ancylobacter defluvii]
MAKKTFYVVQPFEAGKRGAIKAGIPMEVRNAADAERIARRISLVKLGAIAFSTEVEPESGDADPPVLIASFGQVPEGLLDAI